MKDNHVINTTRLQTKTPYPVPHTPYPKIKICGLFREQDIDYVNEAKPDYAGFVFAESKRQVSPAFTAGLRRLLLDEIVPVGVFVNATVADIVALYNENIIAIAQLHGTEDDEYITRLKEASASEGNKPIAVIKTISPLPVPCSLFPSPHSPLPSLIADYYLLDSGAGSGKAFNWELLNSANMNALKAVKPWFLAGGVGLDNIEQALSFNPFALDISSGAETDGIKDRGKIVQLVSIVRAYAGTQRNKV
jgi:phosphoribosylanthranilate isomerase